MDIPNDETLAAQIQAAINSDSKLKQCIMCRHYDKASGYCEETRMKMMPYVRGCNGRLFETDKDFRVAEFMHFCSKMLRPEPKDNSKGKHIGNTGKMSGGQVV